MDVKTVYPVPGKVATRKPRGGARAKAGRPKKAATVVLTFRVPKTYKNSLKLIITKAITDYTRDMAILKPKL